MIQCFYRGGEILPLRVGMTPERPALPCRFAYVNTPERTFNMKKFAALLLCLLLFSGAALADSVSFGAASFPRDAESIDLGDQAVEDFDAFIAFLGEFPNLKNVDMFTTLIESKQIDKLVAAFPDIHFGWTIHITHKHYIRTDQTAWSTLHGQCAPHPSKVFNVLKYCTELRALDIGHNVVTDISFLENLTHLRVLILACNPDLKNIQVLGSLKELEYIELLSTGISDLTPLSELPNLMDLNVANNRVKNWESLLNCKSLRRLWIPVNDKAANQIREALPDCLVVNHGSATGNPWRRYDDGSEHPHYSIIYRMFREDRYIPFEESAPWEDPNHGEIPTRTEHTGLLDK